MGISAGLRARTTSRTMMLAFGTIALAVVLFLFGAVVYLAGNESAALILMFAFGIVTFGIGLAAAALRT